MSAARRGAHRRSRPARRAAERARRRADRGQDRADRAPAPTPACRRSRPAASCRRNGCRRWRTTPRCWRGIRRKPGVSLSGAGAEPEGLRGGAAPRARRRSRSSAPPPRRSRRRTSTARSPRASSASRPSPRRRRAQGIRVRGYVSCVLGCPYEGEVAAASASPTSPRRCYDMGCYEVSLGDTIGVGTPGKTQGDDRGRARGACRSRSSPATSTTPTARRSPTSTPRSSSASPTFDSSVAGLGGCPYADGRLGQRRDRGRASTCCTAWASRPASISTSWRMRGASFAIISAARQLQGGARPGEPRQGRLGPADGPRAKGLLSRRHEFCRGSSSSARCRNMGHLRE